MPIVRRLVDMIEAWRQWRHKNAEGGDRAGKRARRFDDENAGAETSADPGNRITVCSVKGVHRLIVSEIRTAMSDFITLQDSALQSLKGADIADPAMTPDEEVSAPHFSHLPSSPSFPFTHPLIHHHHLSLSDASPRHLLIGVPGGVCTQCCCCVSRRADNGGCHRPPMTCCVSPYHCVTCTRLSLASFPAVRLGTVSQTHAVLIHSALSRHKVDG